jgi:hypothetical protein
MSESVGTGDNGRGGDGRFACGNAFAKGNPNHLKAAKLRAALLAAVSEDELAKAATAVLAKALAGDVIAFRELCDRVLGKPSSSDLIERVEKLEELIEGRYGQS